MASILIHGGNRQSREVQLEKVLDGLGLKESENNPDLIFIEPEDEKKSIGIGQVRESLKFLNEKPLSHKTKAIVIRKAEILTDQAQNAMLKTLEEHPSYATVILCSKTENDLLQTVISRCRKINVKQDESREHNLPTISDVLDLNLGERLAWVAENLPETKEEVIEMLEFWVLELRGDKGIDLTPESVERVQTVLGIKKDLENTNVATKLALENLVLKLK